MMISWLDVYKIASVMVPLYVALILGYVSGRWLKMFNKDHCLAINKLNLYYVLPFFFFQFTSSIDPYNMQYRVLMADVISKGIIAITLALWAKLWQGGTFGWAITTFSLAGFGNTLVIGVPLLKAMNGELGEALVVQYSVLQALVWSPLLLFLYEIWKATHSEPLPQQHSSPPLLSIMQNVLKKFCTNPNFYSRVLGLVWALIAKRWGLHLPSIIEGSIMIMATGGSGISMFSTGLFIALQDQGVLACGVWLIAYGMLLRFVAAPLTMIIGCLALGVRSTTLHIAIIQAALPLATNCFTLAQEYGLHANVLSAALAFGTIISLPLLIAYNAVLGSI